MVAARPAHEWYNTVVPLALSSKCIHLQWNFAVKQFVCYTHGQSLCQDLMEHPICSTGGVFEERVEYITKYYLLYGYSTNNTFDFPCNIR